MKPVMLMMAVSLALAVVQAPGATWDRDFRYQITRNRPAIDACYTDATRAGFDIDAQSYRILIDLASDTGQRVRSLIVKAPPAGSDVLTGKGIYLQITDLAGDVFSTLNAKAPSRVNVYRRGAYYIETHWLDLQFVDQLGKIAPVKGEVVFYSYPEKTHVGAILHVTGQIEVASASVVCEFDGLSCGTRALDDSSPGTRLNDFCLIARSEPSPTCTLIYPVPKGVDEVAVEKMNSGGVRVSNCVYSSDVHNGAAAKWVEGDKPAAYFEILPLPNGEVTSEMEAEADPLLSGAIQTSRGRALGYDPVRGCYKVQTDNLGGFTYHYENPNAYEVAAFSIRNNATPRKVYVLHETWNHPGSVECGVLLDDTGATLPVTVQISKNFSGEKEEPFYNPNDTPFSETIFPLYLDADEERSLTSLHLYQNWGSHPLKQFSSLGAWMDYYHMSTGVTETTCYVPFMFAGLNGVAIADLRPMSQRMWDSQPQHDNVAGHSFLRYQDNERWNFLEYTGTTFRSTGPNWADMSLNYLSDDGKAKVRLDVFELPQTDELRNFIHMRIDFLGDIEIKDGDFARNMRLLNIASWVQQLRYTTVAYGGPSSEVTELPIKLTDDFTVAGAPLPAANGWAAEYPEKRGANAYIVRRFEGRMDGESVSPGVSMLGQKNGDTVLMLVPVTEAKKVRAGDYLDIDLFIMPYGGETQDYKPARKAAFDYGANAPKVTDVTRGTKLADFPTRIALDEDGTAEFAVAGGMNCIPIIVEGSKTYKCQRLYSVDNGKTLIDLAQRGERDGYQVFVQDDGRFGWVFLVLTDGKGHRYRVE